MTFHSAAAVVHLVRKEILEARRNKWVLLYAVAFALLSIPIVRTRKTHSSLSPSEFRFDWA